MKGDIYSACDAILKLIRDGLLQDLAGGDKIYTNKSMMNLWV